LAAGFEIKDKGLLAEDVLWCRDRIANYLDANSERQWLAKQVFIKMFFFPIN
jgi:hypothetical protein